MGSKFLALIVVLNIQPLANAHPIHDEVGCHLDPVRMEVAIDKVNEPGTRDKILVTPENQVALRFYFMFLSKSVRDVIIESGLLDSSTPVPQMIPRAVVLVEGVICH